MARLSTWVEPHGTQMTIDAPHPQAEWCSNFERLCDFYERQNAACLHPTQATPSTQPHTGLV